jgi:hypothetical protein
VSRPVVAALAATLSIAACDAGAARPAPALYAASGATDRVVRLDPGTGSYLLGILYAP